MNKEGRKEHKFTKPKVEGPHPDLNYILILIFILVIFGIAYLAIPSIYIMALVIVLAVVTVVWFVVRKGQ